MKLYISLSRTDIELANKIKPLYILHSFYPIYYGSEKDKKFLLEYKYYPKFFLDSGGYTMLQKYHSRKKAYPEDYIQGYIEFLKEFEKFFEVYANLDNPHSAEETLKNQEILEKEGLKPLPVYNISWPEDVLKRYRDNGYKYVALGGLVPFTRTKEKRKILFEKVIYILKEYPEIKFHLFGIAEPNLMKYFMFYKNCYSSDTSSYFLEAFGIIHIWDDKAKTLKTISLKTKKEFGLDVNSNQLRYINLLSFKKYQEYLDSYGSKED